LVCPTAALPPEPVVEVISVKRSASDPLRTMVSFAVKLDAVLAMLYEEPERPNGET
jgi:ABC-type histidine transport system ATPase subunit